MTLVEGQVKLTDAPGIGYETIPEIFAILNSEDGYKV